MAGKKSNLLTTATETAAGQKRQRTESNENTDSTKRGGRMKHFNAPDPVASKRGTQSAKAQGKRTSEAKTLIEVVIPMDDVEDDSQLEKVVFIDDYTHEPTLMLYRKNEKAEPMANLWADFISATQSARDHMGVEVVGTFLSKEESAAIDLKNNYHLFPSLVTAKGSLRSKDNHSASNAATRTGGKFAKGAAATIGSKRELENRAHALRNKAAAIVKQAKAYDIAAENMDDDDEEDIEEETGEPGMKYIGDIVPLTRKDLDKYMAAHESHLTATAERLRGDMAGLAAYVQRAEKRLRDLIQLKVAADLKLCRDIKKFGRFEFQKWQMEALPTGTHTCQCTECSTNVRLRNRPAYRYPSTVPQVEQDDALPPIKLEKDNDEQLDQPMKDAGLYDEMMEDLCGSFPPAEDTNIDAPAVSSFTPINKRSSITATAPQSTQNYDENSDAQTAIGKPDSTTIETKETEGTEGTYLMWSVKDYCLKRMTFDEDTDERRAKYGDAVALGIGSDSSQAAATATVPADSPQAAAAATVPADSPQAAAAATVPADSPQAAAAAATVPADSPQAAAAAATVPADSPQAAATAATVPADSSQAAATAKGPTTASQDSETK